MQCHRDRSTVTDGVSQLSKRIVTLSPVGGEKGGAVVGCRPTVCDVGGGRAVGRSGRRGRLWRSPNVEEGTDVLDTRCGGCHEPGAWTREVVNQPDSGSRKTIWGGGGSVATSIENPDFYIYYT